MSYEPNAALVAIGLAHTPHACRHLTAFAIVRLMPISWNENDRQRVEHLFALYEKLTAPLLPAAKSKRARRAGEGKFSA